MIYKEVKLNTIMSLPINQQQQLIKRYFNALVREFITDPRHNKYIKIVFVDHLESPKKNSIKLGDTKRSGGGSKTFTEWETINGVKVSGSERATTTYYPYKYKVKFLNNYEDTDQLRGTVVHEFAHLYLFATIDVDGKHGHDDRFYSTME